ncbi:hypothetical protein A4S06_00770 [Erysipelotrichaceae bacterium MTC7]|nr:hypothetical protein A4S06_00770 [Erysipelotrichaceae bacterium MTC7]
MIKLILSDMDGTLSHSDKSIPKKADAIFEELLQRGYAVGIATGRSLASVQRDFPKFKDRFTIIAENGGVLFHQGKIIYTSKLDPSVVDQITTEVRKYKDIVPILATAHAAYGLKEHERFANTFHVYYPTLIWVDSFAEVDDDVVKMALYFEGYNSKDYEKIFAPIKGDSDLAISASEWMDFSKTGVNKGFGIRKLEELLNLRKDEIMAFGDYLNDYQMLQEVGESYAMSNAHPEVKKVAKHIIGSNDEEAVLTTLEDFLRQA